MNTASTDLSQPPHKGRKLALMIGGGALTGFFGALGLMTLIDGGALGSLGPSREIALLVAMLYGFMGVLVGFGALSPRLGARFLNVQDAEELREMRQSLLASGIGSVAFGGVLAVLALTGPGAVLAPMAGAVAAGVLLVIATLASVRSMKHSDELMRTVSRQAGSTAFYLVLLFIGGWAALSIFGFMPQPQMIDILTLIWAILIIATFGVCAKRGMLGVR